MRKLILATVTSPQSPATRELPNREAVVLQVVNPILTQDQINQAQAPYGASGEEMQGSRH
jgi:hypothetical protein